MSFQKLGKDPKLEQKLKSNLTKLNKTATTSILQTSSQNQVNTTRVDNSSSCSSCSSGNRRNMGTPQFQNDALTPVVNFYEDIVEMEGSPKR